MIEHISSEIADIRRKHAVAVLKPEYKMLTQYKGQDLLFGGDISKHVKKLDLTNCVASRDSSQKPRNHLSRSSGVAGSSRSFLGHGRASYQKAQYNQRTNNNNNNRYRRGQNKIFQ